MRLALAALAALALAGCSRTVEHDGETGALVDELDGAYRGVTMGDSIAEVRRVFGQPQDGQGFAPADMLPSEAGVPQSIPAPFGPPTLLRYPDVAFLVGESGVYAFIVTEDDARSRRGVAIGDGLDDARSAYQLRCGEVAAGETASGVATYPSCSTTVEGRTRVWFGKDPIRSITLLSLTVSR